METYSHLSLFMRLVLFQQRLHRRAITMLQFMILLIQRSYTLTATYSSVMGSRETESNDARSTADTITSGVAITGQAASSTDIDYYKLALSSAGTIFVSFNDGDGSQWYGHDVSIVNENGDILASQSIYETGVVSTEVASSGNYYVAVYDSFDTEDYTLTATYSSVTGSREIEPNDTYANLLTPGRAIIGQVFHPYTMMTGFI